MGNQSSKSSSSPKNLTNNLPEGYETENFSSLPFGELDIKHTDFENKVVIIVNVACKWGFTKSSYTALREFLEEFGEENFRVLCFPCNQFGSQEPWDLLKICSFVENKFQLPQSKGFQIGKKIEVNGAGAAPIYNWLRNATQKFEKVNWNFNTAFLVDRSGNVKRYDSFRWSNMHDKIKKLVHVQVTLSEESNI